MVSSRSPSGNDGGGTRQPAMTVQVFGLSHATAPVALRERVAFADASLARHLHSAQQALALTGVAILSTCNRTEIYATGDASLATFADWLANAHRVPAADLLGSCYTHRDGQALRHMMRVAGGLDSLVLGEPQIFGQMKSAYLEARAAGTISTTLEQSFQSAFAAAKRVRSETAIGANPVSVAYAAVGLARQIFGRLDALHAMLIGAGDTIELVARHLADAKLASLTFANRTPDRATLLAARHSGQAIPLAELPEQLHRADLVITATASPVPVLGKGAVESALKRRRHRPMLMVDIAVPRDIEPEVGRLDDVYLYTVDDLREVIQEGRRAREAAAQAAEAIIDLEVARWQRRQLARDAVGLIRAYRGHAATVRDAEVEKALRALEGGQPPEAVLRQLANSLTNKLLHHPTAGLKRAGEEGRQESLRWLRELFEPDRPESS